MSNLQTRYYFKLDFQKVDQHSGGKWLIHNMHVFMEFQNRKQQLNSKNDFCKDKK